MTNDKSPQVAGIITLSYDGSTNQEHLDAVGQAIESGVRIALDDGTLIPKGSSLTAKLDSVKSLNLAPDDDFAYHYGEFLESHNGRDHLVKFLFKAPYGTNILHKMMEIMTDFRGEEVESRGRDHITFECGITAKIIKHQPLAPLKFTIMQDFLSVLD